jgi:hypothetical protein
MKKKFIYLASVALTAGLAACSSDELLDEASDLVLQKGELAATIESTASTRVNVKDYQITWDRVNGESIGVYGTYGTGGNSQSYFQYDLKNTSEADKAKASFAANNKSEIPDGFTPTYAFYPYSTTPAKSVANGKLVMKLASDITYKEGAVDLPMVGKVNDGKIAFQPVVSLLKVTVVNMPSNINYAKLSADAGVPLAGTGSINLKEDPYTLTLAGTTNAVIIRNASGFTEKSTVDFYFSVPAGTYIQGDGLTFCLGKTSESTDTDEKATYSATLVCGVNEMYTAVLRYEDGGTIQDAKLSALNEKLANGDTNVDADLSSSAGTIYVPKGGDDITMTLKLGASKAIKIVEGEALATATTKADDAVLTTPKVTINVTKDTPTTGTSLDIELPDSPVTLGTADALTSSDATKTTLAAVTANTSEDILTVGKDVEITALTLDGKTNVLVKTGGKVTKVEANKENAGLFGFYEDKVGDITSGTTTDKTVEIADFNAYQLYYPDGTKPIVLDAEQEMSKTITISAGKEVTIDLNGQSLSNKTAGQSVLNVKGILNIKDSSDDETGSVTSALAADAIVIEENGILNLQSGTLTKTSSNAPVKVNGGKLNVIGGKITTSVTSGKAIDVVAGSAIVNIGGDAITKSGEEKDTEEETIVCDVTGDIAVAGGASFTLQAGNVDGTVSATGAADNTTTVAISGGKLIPTGESAKALDITASAGDVTVNISGAAEVSASDDVISLTGVNGGAKKATLNISGTAKVSATAASKSAIVDETGPATINIQGGTVSSAKDAAISATAGSEITVTGGTIEGVSSAVSLTSGKLTVPATATSDIELKGEKVISAVPTDAKGVILTLASDKAVYTGVAATAGNKVYTVYNTSGTSTAANAAVMTISAGEFHGDIISDAAEDFITGGNFYDAKNLYAQRDTYVVFGKTLYWNAISDDDGYLYVGALASAK